ncbi:MAG: DUF2798 domain-containing protein [Erysipelotrichaceae bacterium]|nr:DUF2798 domain-containing protein [Erysipelotrichaceae bacterium]
MKRTKFQNIIFTLVMATVMVYGMICYNIALAMGGMNNEIFLLALHEMVVMVPIAFVLEYFMVEKAALALAFRIVRPDDRPLAIQLTISAMIVWLMCPLMSLVAAILFKQPGNQLLSIWLQTTILNFPMAFFWQMFFAGPLVRTLFTFVSQPKLSSQQLD